MSSSIYTGLILFALLHLGMSYSIWSSKKEHHRVLNATLDIFKAVKKNPHTFDTDEESKLLASQLSSLLNQVFGIRTRYKSLNDDPLRYAAELINLLVKESDDLELQIAELEVYNNQVLYVNDYLQFLDGHMLPQEVKAFVHKAVELDNEQNYEHNKTMSSFFKILTLEAKEKFKNYHKKFPLIATFLNELRKYNERNEWEAFMMMTTAYKLQSLELNDNNYEKEFQRLRKQLMNKLALYAAEFNEALDIVRANE